MQDLAEQMPERDAQAAEILATVLGWLAMNTRAEDPLHRQRTLLLIKHVLKGLVRGKRPLDEEAQELLEGRCLERLDDKIAVVRKTAVDVLPYLFILSGNVSTRHAWCKSLCTAQGGCAVVLSSAVL